jgi:hypothetical protein
MDSSEGGEKWWLFRCKAWAVVSVKAALGPFGQPQVGNLKQLFSYCERTLTLAHRMSGGFLALQAKKSKERRQTLDLEDAFKSADTDKDGKLSLEEWVDVLQKTGQNISRYSTFVTFTSDCGIS